MSVRFRLTLWYSLVLALLVALFSLGLYLVLSYSLRAEIDELIWERAGEVEKSLTVVLRRSGNPLQRLTAGVIVLPPINVFASPGVYLQVLTPEGFVVAESENLGTASLPRSGQGFDRALAGRATLETVRLGGSSLRLLTAPLHYQGSTLGVIQVGASLDGVQRTLERVAILLLLGSLAAVTVAMAGGSFLAGKALQPIEHMNRSAQTITHSADLRQRLSVRSRDELGRLAGTLNEMLQTIEDLFHTQERFFAAASHELRTPITILRSSVDLMIRGAVKGREERREVLQEMKRELERMSRLVSDLLFLARPRAGLEVQMQPVALAEVLQEASQQARHLARGQRVELELDGQPQVRGDPLRLRQLVLNLVENALRATPPGGRIVLKSSVVDGFALVEVSDTGRGIPQEHLPHIFEPFYRVGSERDGGLGLGLAIAREIVRAHKGEIAVHSSQEGTTFSVRLPLSDAEPGFPC